MCRRHLQSANFQVEALETECSRLLALEDQLVSVFRLLQKGRSQCLSRKTLGQLLLDVIDSSFCDEEQGNIFPVPGDNGNWMLKKHMLSLYRAGVVL